MRTYIRKFGRDQYETLVVEALVACGYEVTLSTGFQDERLGVDVWDTETGIAWDLLMGPQCGERYQEKVWKHDGRVAVLCIPISLIEDLRLCVGTKSPRLRNVLTKLDQIYSEALAEVKLSPKALTLAQAQQLEVAWQQGYRRRLAA